jgi:hypothetical protein
MLRRPPCVEEGIEGSAQNDLVPAEEDELRPQMEPPVEQLLARELPGRCPGRTDHTALRRFLAQKLL